MIKFDADGVILGLNIQDTGEQFLDVEITLKGDYIHYNTSGKLMERADLVELKQAIDKMMRDEITHIVIVTGAEPDWYVKIYPTVGAEPYLEFCVCFWAPNGELSANEFILTLIGDDVTKLRNYICEVLGD